VGSRWEVVGDVHFGDGAVVNAVEVRGHFVAVREKNCVLATVEYWTFVLVCFRSPHSPVSRPLML